MVLLGIPFDNVTTAQAVERIEQMVASRQPHYLATANVDFLVQALRDVELHRILTEAHLVLCDGMPLVWASRLMGNPLAERVAGSDLVPLLIEVAARKNYRVFFLGASAQSAESCCARLRERYPSLIIAGHYSPPFAPLLEMNHEEICRQIKEARPDLLFVSFGCPKQEKWIAMHYRTLGVPVVAGVGATIDFLAGQSRRAPMWMRKSGLEWLHRLAQEPRRLAGRYARGLTVFSRAIFQQWWRMRFRQSKAASKRGLPQPAPAGSHYGLLNLAGVDFMDTTGVGILLRLQKQARAAGRKLILVAPSRAVRSALALMRLDGFFLMAADMAAARRLMQNFEGEQPVRLRPNYFPSRPSVFWQGEITAANAEEVWRSTCSQMVARGKKGSRFLIDVSALKFIDSAGAWLMLRAREIGRRDGLEIVFTGIQPAVRNVLRFARVESVLLGAAP
jgi:N-acetylglucosaminyldiphosphoundecaprenol N-acetyl-beta-D-mannosaminyltransferase